MLKLPATPQSALREVVIPGLALLPGRLDSIAARLMILVIFMQESNLAVRAQVLNSGGKGPARGLPQAEKIGVKEVCENRASRDHMRDVAAKRSVEFGYKAIWAAMEFDDLLSAVVARLLLLTDAKALPKLGDLQGAFDYYVRVWKPGAASTPAGRAKCLARWRRHYPRALEAVTA